MKFIALPAPDMGAAGSRHRWVARAAICALVPFALAQAEVRTLTLREAVSMALKQSPDLVIARLDQTKAQLGVKVAKDPFSPKLYGGSGAAWTSGYPVTINGGPPSIFEAKASMAVYNRSQSYIVAQARENARGAELDVTRQQEEIAYRTASLYLDAQQAARGIEVATRQVDSLTKVVENVKTRVGEGRELEIQNKRAELSLARARQRVEALAADQEDAEEALAIVLGFNAEDRVRAVRDEMVVPPVPDSEDAAAESAVANNKEIRVLESRIQAKTLEIRSSKAARLPVVDLVAQYDLLAKYNFQDYFATRFQRHNGQLGVSITIPLIVGPAAQAYVSQGETDLAKLKAQFNQARGRIITDTRKSYQEVRKAETARKIARLDLDVAREQLTISLAQYEEGRVSLRDVEQSRVDENDKWIAYYDAQRNLEKVQLNLLRQQGTLAASLR